MVLEPLIRLKEIHQKLDILSLNFCWLSLWLIQHLQLNSQILLSRSSLEPLISLDLVSTNLYCF